MMPKLDPKQLEKAMKQLGMKMEPIEATEVIIKTPHNEIVISSPQITKINAMGQETFQIIGISSERELGGNISKEDIQLIMAQAKVSEEKAKKALEETGDIAAAILKLQKH